MLQLITTVTFNGDGSPPPLEKGLDHLNWSDPIHLPYDVEQLLLSITVAVADDEVPGYCAIYVAHFDGIAFAPETVQVLDAQYASEQRYRPFDRCLAPCFTRTTPYLWPVPLLSPTIRLGAYKNVTVDNHDLLTIRVLAGR
jgi:hypothetical protein